MDSISKSRCPVDFKVDNSLPKGSAAERNGKQTTPAICVTVIIGLSCLVTTSPIYAEATFVPLGVFGGVRSSAFEFRPTAQSLLEHILTQNLTGIICSVGPLQERDSSPEITEAVLPYRRTAQFWWEAISRRRLASRHSGGPRMEYLKALVVCLADRRRPVVQLSMSLPMGMLSWAGARVVAMRHFVGPRRLA